MSYKSNLPTLIPQLKRANTAAADAAADVYVAAMKKELEPGYTSGDFASGESVEHVKKSAPEPTVDGVAVRVGTDLLHNLLWELGHYSPYTRKFERQERWFPTAVSTRAQQLEAARRAHQQVMVA